MRRDTERGFADVRARCENEPDLLMHGAAYVLYALMDKVVDRYFPVLDALETELESVEEQIFVRNTARSNIESLYALKRKLMTLKHAVDPLMEAVGKLYGGRVPRSAPAWGNISATSTTICSGCTPSIEGIRDMLTTAIQVNLGMISLNETEVTKKLAGVGRHYRGSDVDRRHLRHELQVHAGARLVYGYPLSLAMMVAVDVALYFWFKRIRWL